MEAIPFVDTIGDDRIQAILDDPANFNFRTVRAGTFQDWVPDTGTYLSRPSYRMQNGVFRTVGLARSGVPAELRHRFWMKDYTDRVVGRKHVGLLIYDSEADDYTFEVIAGSDPACGRCGHGEHDNRRQPDRPESEPVEILSGHIPFTVRGIGKGPCYLESASVFLPQCPRPSSFVPEISRLTGTGLRRQEAGQAPSGGLTAEVHFVTREAATAVVTVAALFAPRTPAVQARPRPGNAARRGPGWPPPKHTVADRGYDYKLGRWDRGPRSRSIPTATPACSRECERACGDSPPGDAQPGRDAAHLRRAFGR